MSQKLAIAITATLLSLVSLKASPAAAGDFPPPDPAAQEVPEPQEETVAGLAFLGLGLLLKKKIEHQVKTSVKSSSLTDSPQ